MRVAGSSHWDANSAIPYLSLRQGSPQLAQDFSDVTFFVFSNF